jgi:hypothetical protein
MPATAVYLRDAVCGAACAARSINSLNNDALPGFGDIAREVDTLFNIRKRRKRLVEADLIDIPLSVCALLHLDKDLGFLIGGHGILR